MITNAEKIDKCDERIKGLVKYIEGLYSNVVITSGYRSESENQKAGGVKGSYHTYNPGLAVDLYVPNLHVFKLMGALFGAHQKLGFKGAGINLHEGYIHIDFRPTDKIECWAYDANNRPV